MATVTVTPIVEAGHVPPRVRLDVTDTGSPSIFSTTVTRLDPDGRWVPVRTEDGGTLALSTSGSSRVGLVYDYEAPYGAEVRYSTEESPGVQSAAVTVDETRVWLVHPGVPALSMPVELRAGSFDEEVLSAHQGVFWPMGREYPVVRTDGQRKAPSGSLTVAVEALDDLQALKSLLRDAAVLRLNVPQTANLGVDSCYIAVGDVRNRRISGIGSDTYRAVDLPYQVVDRPSGGSQSARTFAHVAADYATFADVEAAYGTFFDLLAGP